MAKSVTKTLSATKRRQAQHLKFGQGRVDGREWVDLSDPLDVRKYIDTIGWGMPPSLREPWVTCRFPDLRKRLESQGKAYTAGFIQGVQIAFQATHAALVHHHHHEGVQDGRRWASEFADRGQLSRLETFATGFDGQSIFIGPFPDGEWTPAHFLVAYLLDDAYPVDDDDEQLDDCREFREFWQPFMNEPMDEVMSKLNLYKSRAGYKLQDRHYVAGFIDGALGLSETIGQRLSDRVSAPVRSDDGKHNM